MNLPKLNKIAKVIDRSEDGITFQVDDVEKLSTTLPAEGAFKHFIKRNETRLLAFSHNDSVEFVQDCNVHPLVAAVHLAFSQHRPLRLTPDHIWLTIAQGFAHHVNNNAEDLRPRLAGFRGKMVLQERTYSLKTAEDWIPVINNWAESIGDFIPRELHQTLPCDFTTTTTAARVASRIVMMDAFQHFFDYRIYCICGIPSMTLAGTVDDWRRIASRVRVLEQYDLQWWTDRLLPICEALVETAAGNPPLEFWRSIYKPEKVYGGELITGWIAELFPYLLHGMHTKASSPTVRNPVLSIPRRKLKVEHGIMPSAVPLGISRAPVTIETETSERAVELVAGFIGVRLNRRQDEQLEPEIGWGVCEARKLSELIIHIKREHQTEAPFSPVQEDGDSLHPEFPPEIHRLVTGFDGATLYADTNHPWRIRRSTEYEDCILPELNRRGTLFIDLADGRCISFCAVDRVPIMAHGILGRADEQLWMIVGKREEHSDGRPQTHDPTSKYRETKVIARGLEQLFERIFERDGQYFFDQIDFVPEERL